MMDFRKEINHGGHGGHGEVKKEEAVLTSQGSRKKLSTQGVSPCAPCPPWFKLFSQNLPAVFAVVNYRGL